MHSAQTAVPRAKKETGGHCLSDSVDWLCEHLANVFVCFTWTCGKSVSSSTGFLSFSDVAVFGSDLARFLGRFDDIFLLFVQHGCVAHHVHLQTSKSRQSTLKPLSNAEAVRRSGSR